MSENRRPTVVQLHRKHRPPPQHLGIPRLGGQQRQQTIIVVIIRVNPQLAHPRPPRQPAPTPQAQAQEVLNPPAADNHWTEDGGAPRDPAAKHRTDKAAAPPKPQPSPDA